MENNISYNSSGKQITDFFVNQPTMNFCQCGKILPVGVMACMPDGEAEPLRIGIRRVADQWQPFKVDPRTDAVKAVRRKVDTPCSALRLAAQWSAEDEVALDAERFDGDFDWALLIRKVSGELATQGEKVAATWMGLWLSGDKRKPIVSDMHPLTLAAYEAAISEAPVRWDIPVVQVAQMEAA